MGRLRIHSLKAHREGAACWSQELGWSQRPKARTGMTSCRVSGGFPHSLGLQSLRRALTGSPEARQECALFLHESKQTCCPELTMINHLRPSPRACAVPRKPVSERWAAHLPKSTSVSHKTPAWTHSQGQGLEMSPVITAHYLGAQG